MGRWQVHPQPLEQHLSRCDGGSVAAPRRPVPAPSWASPARSSSSSSSSQSASVSQLLTHCAASPVARVSGGQVPGLMLFTRCRNRQLSPQLVLLSPLDNYNGPSQHFITPHTKDAVPSFDATPGSLTAYQRKITINLLLNYKRTTQKTKTMKKALRGDANTA